MCKATIEIQNGNKMKADDIHEDLIVKYKKWTVLTPNGVIIGDLPGYVTAKMTM